MTRKTLLAFAVLTALSAGTAFAAAQSDTDARSQRTTLDANGDGFIDRSEAARHPRLAERFDRIDDNRDGRLSRDEMPARGARGRHGGAHALKTLDTDGDGRLSRAEAAAAPGYAERFERMDLDRNGYVDRADRQQRMKQRNDEWFVGADADRNGQLSRAEYDAAHARRWEARASRKGAKAAQ